MIDTANRILRNNLVAARGLLPPESPHRSMQTIQMLLGTAGFRCDKSFHKFEEAYRRVEERLPLATLRGWRRQLPLATADHEQEQKASQKDDSCAICMDQLTEIDEILDLPCSHSFHESCISQWLRHHQTCPACRFTLKPAAESEQT